MAQEEKKLMIPNCINILWALWKITIKAAGKQLRKSLHFGGLAKKDN